MTDMTAPSWADYLEAAMGSGSARTLAELARATFQDSTRRDMDLHWPIIEAALTAIALALTEPATVPREVCPRCGHSWSVHLPSGCRGEGKNCPCFWMRATTSKTPESCPSCHGTRGTEDDGRWAECPDCAGTGKAANSISTEKYPDRVKLGGSVTENGPKVALGDEFDASKPVESLEARAARIARTHRLRVLGVTHEVECVACEWCAQWEPEKVPDSGTWIAEQDRAHAAHLALVEYAADPATGQRYENGYFAGVKAERARHVAEFIATGVCPACGHIERDDDPCECGHPRHNHDNERGWDDCQCPDCDCEGFMLARFTRANMAQAWADGWSDGWHQRGHIVSVKTPNPYGDPEGTMPPTWEPAPRGWREGAAQAWEHGRQPVWFDHSKLRGAESTVPMGLMGLISNTQGPGSGKTLLMPLTWELAPRGWRDVVEQAINQIREFDVYGPGSLQIEATNWLAALTGGEHVNLDEVPIPPFEPAPRGWRDTVQRATTWLAAVADWDRADMGEQVTRMTMIFVGRSLAALMGLLGEGEATK